MTRKVVYITAGLDDRTEHIKNLVARWSDERLDVRIVPFGWQDTSISTEEAYERHL